MKIIISGCDFRYELENVARLFVPDVEICGGGTLRWLRSNARDYAYFKRAASPSGSNLLVAVCVDDKRAALVKTLAPHCGGEDAERELALMFYDIMADLTGKRPVWGIMTGVRPAKFVRIMLDRGYSERYAAEFLREKYSVAEEKALLAVETARVSRRFAKQSGADSYSLYVSIPFCPSRCEYCSFVSKTVEREGLLLSAYLDKLMSELCFISDIACSLNLRLETVYVGGGTPTVLDEPELESLCAVIERLFLNNTAREYTFEAGRPDTISLGKLRILKAHGVTRLSINPQTFSDTLLAAMGRPHTAKDVERAFALAREAGFSNINSDLIAGLPKDTAASFRQSVVRLLALKPEGVTVHALTLKRASFLREHAAGIDTGVLEMTDIAGGLLTGGGYRPYYMYKQKGTPGNAENTGYSLEGYEGLYNICIMDERHTILSAGAAGVTKLVDQTSGRIERVFNYKYPREYIEGFETILARKERILGFYEGL